MSLTGTLRRSVPLWQRIGLLALGFFLLPGALLQTQPGRRALRVPQPAQPPAARRERSPAKLQDTYSHLPLSFEANRGQFPGPTQFVARGSGYSVALTPREAVLSLCRTGPAGSSLRASRQNHAGRRSARDHRQSAAVVLRLKLLRANPAPVVTAEQPLVGKVNYFLGNDPKQWRTNVPTSGRVRYRQVYPGIDLTYYGSQRQLEYDFIVSPGADPRRICLGIRGAQGARVNPIGDLVLRAAGGDVVQHAPVTYQVIGGKRRALASRYVLQASARQVSFQVGAYDPRRPLIIDPVLSYSTFLGGNSGDGGRGIAVDSAGSAYVTGFTNSTDFPTRGPLQPASHGADLFVTKLSPDGGSLVYSTYLGGSDTENARAIAVDGAGNACVTGDTASTDFPTVHALLPAKPGGAGGTTAFVSKLNATGSALLFSTYLGGTGFRETGYGIAADAAGSTYVAGFTQSGDFPTFHAFQPQSGGGSADGFITKFNPDGTLAYSSFLGGNGSSDSVFALAVDPAGNAYVTGQTDSTDFPTRNALQRNHSGGFYDAFVTEVNAAGTALVYSTYLGGDATPNGGSALGLGIAADAAGNAYVTGEADTTSFHTTPGALQPTNPGSNAFVTKLSPGGGSFVYSTYFGGSRIGQCNGIAADANGNAYVTGYTASADFPVKNSLQPFRSGTYGFVSSFDPLGLLVYSTLLGGASSGNELGNAIAADAGGNTYVTGGTGSDDFPTVNPVQATRAGVNTFDAFIVKLALAGGPPPPPPATHFSLAAPATVTAGVPLSITLTALDSANNPVPGYRGTVHFTSPDPQATLPADYAFTAADAGAHSFSATLKSAGAQSLTGTDTAKPTLTGSTPISVTAAAPADLRFGQQPTNAAPNAVIAPPVTVMIVDAFGNTVTTANDSVSLALSANPGGGTLNGTVTIAAVNGVATFNTLSIDKAGNGYTLAPSASGLPGPFTASTPFNIAAKPATHFSVIAPASANSGTAFDVTVTALDADNKTATGYTGAVHWSSTDPQAVLPADYTFTAGDGGVHHFSVTLKTVGSKTITVMDRSTPSINGTATVNVTEAVSFVVTTAADTILATDNVTSLREAILAANAHPGLDTITFKIPGSGLKSIAPTTPLPTITDPVIIDGYSQPGAKVNTASFATNATLLIEISGIKAPKGANGLTLTAGGSIVKGLVINRFQQDAAFKNGVGILLKQGGGNTIAGCFLGMSATGKAIAANVIGGTGAYVEGSPGNTLGGALPAAANLISENVYGVYLHGAGAAGNTILGNLIGTELSGNAAVSKINTAGIVVEDAPQNTVGPANVISGNAFGLQVRGGAATGNVIQRNLIGTNGAGTQLLPNTNAGVTVLSPNNRVGPGNLISGNPDGLFIGAGGIANVVQGNQVGTDVTGKKALANQNGIKLGDGASGNLIGGDAPGARNVISGNLSNGVFISSVGTSGNQVQGNYIGVNTAGTGAVANGNGVVLFNAPGNQVGGATPGGGNVISGNKVSGILIVASGAGTAAGGNRVQGNKIGTNAAGTAAIPNGYGVTLGAASGNTIGGVAPGAGNLISGNTTVGVELEQANATDPPTTQNQVQGNLVGTNASGSAALPNGVGIRLLAGVTNNLIGGTETGARNVISGNKTTGIAIGGAGANANKIQGNYIGTTADGASALPNPLYGIAIQTGASSTLVGGTAPGAGNLISGSEVYNVLVQGASTIIQGNYIGTDAGGTRALDKGGKNIGIADFAANTLIGGTTPGAGNLVSGNGTGIGLAGTGSIVQGNFVGTNFPGTAAVPNTSGVSVTSNNSNALIGGPQPGAGNLISGNVRGLVLSSNRCVVQGNRIGTNLAGTAPLPNTDMGIAVAGDGNTIGGIVADQGNLIVANKTQGVLVYSGVRNAIRGNSIFGNSKLGIDLVKAGDPASGVTPNDAGDKDSGANGLQNHPVLTDVSTGPGQPLIKFALNSTPNTKFVIDVYVNDAPDPSGSGPGQNYNGSIPVTTDSAGNASFTVIPRSTEAGKYYTATASRDYGGGIFETSEFSNAIRIPGP